MSGVLGWFTLKRLRGQLAEMVRMGETAQTAALVQLDLQELQELQGQLARLAARVNQVLRAQRVRMENRDLSVPLVLLDPRESREPDASPTTSMGNNDAE